MFCKKCGKRIADDAIVCPNCETPTELSETETVDLPEDEAVTAVDNENQEIIEDVPVKEEAPQNDNNDAVVSEGKEASSEKKEKRKIKKGVIITGVVALILCIAVVILTFPYIKNAFARMFMSSEDYFAYVVKNNSEDSAKSIANTMDGLKKSTLNGASATGSANIEVEEPFHDVLADVTSDVKIGGKIGSVLGKFMDLSVGGLTEWIDELSVDYEMNSDGKNSQAIFNVDVNDAEFGKIDVATDKKNKITYIGVPDYCDGYFIAEKNKETDSAVQMAETILASLPEKELTETLIMKYIECIAENVGDVEETTKTVDAGKFSKKFVTLTAKIDADEMADITDKLLDEIESDKELADIIGEIAKTSGKSEADIRKSLEDVFKNFNEFYKKELKGNLTLTLYVDAKGTIIGTELTSGKFEFSNCTITKWFEIGNTIKGKAGIVSFELSGNGKLSENKVNLDYKLGVAGTHVSDINIFDLDYKKMKDGLFDAKMKIDFSEEVSKVGSMFIKDEKKDSVTAKLINVIPDITVNIDLSQKSSDETAVNAKINYKNELAVSAGISNKNGEKKSVKIPKKHIDIIEIGVVKALTSVDLEKFIEFLGEAEFPKAGVLKIGYKLIFK